MTVCGDGSDGEKDFTLRGGAAWKPGGREARAAVRAPWDRIEAEAEAEAINAGAPPSPVSATNLSDLGGPDGFRIEGREFSDRSGYSVSSAGDVNGDGFDDVLIGAFAAERGPNDFIGESYVVFGKAGEFAGSLDLESLDGANGYRLEGIDERDSSGFSVASAGDINGDGFDDVIIGAPLADPEGRNSAGESYVVFGKASGSAILDLASLDGSNGFRIDGIDVNDYSGFSVSSAGDVNNDGFDDIVIGARFADPGGDSLAGESYVVFGKAGGFAASLDLAALDGSNGFRLDGIDATDISGFSVSSAGDVNGDGFDDIIIGAPGGDPGGDPSAGESYVIFGRSGAAAANLNLASLDGINGFRVNGFDAGDRSGASVSSAGDVNADGFDDIIIGAPGTVSRFSTSAGAAYVVFGRAGGFAASLNLGGLDGTDGFQIKGISAQDLTGQSVAAAGDVNGDGFGDIIIGAPTADRGGKNAGSAYVILGRANGFVAIDLADLRPADGFVIGGDQPGDYAGQSVSGAGDVNGDGFDDLIVGAPYAAGDKGYSYVIFGSAAIAGETITGDANADSLTGSDASEELLGLGGNDTLNGGGGPDILDGSAGIDWADYTGAARGVTADLATPSGNRGEADGDRYVSIENLRGGAFSDRLRGNVAVNVIDGGAGDDRLEGRGEADALSGELGDDRLDGGDADDSLDGGEGADALLGALGNDTLAGGLGNDVLSGDAGDDSLTGSAGLDLLFGGDGSDLLAGGANGDTLLGGLGEDTLDGGDGADWVDYDRSTQRVIVDLARQANNLGAAAEDSLIAIENLAGTAFADQLRGDSADNVLDGQGGRDRLSGRGGNDTLIGEEGRDTLTGGAGEDLFLFHNNRDDADVIHDFAVADDLIALRGWEFGLAPGPLAASNFRAGAEAQDFDDLIIYDPSNGRLYYDPDGNGLEAQRPIATLANLAPLTAQDFIVG